MSGRRTYRSDGLASATALLDQVAPAHDAITRAMATVRISSPAYTALERASAELHRLAADLGHEGRFAGRAPGRG